VRETAGTGVLAQDMSALNCETFGYSKGHEGFFRKLFLMIPTNQRSIATKSCEEAQNSDFNFTQKGIPPLNRLSVAVRG